MKQYRLFLDLDGVLVDFDAGVKQATGLEPGEQHPRRMWPVLAKTPGFYDKLGWANGGPELWAAVQGFSPVILTGLPIGNWAEKQKRAWCARELGDDMPVITGPSSKKADLAWNWMTENGDTDKIPLLIDDRLQIKESWEKAGGIFILHLATKDSLLALRGFGYPISGLLKKS